MSNKQSECFSGVFWLTGGEFIVLDKVIRASVFHNAKGDVLRVRLCDNLFIDLGPNDTQRFIEEFRRWDENICHALEVSTRMNEEHLDAVKSVNDLRRDNK